MINKVRKLKNQKGFTLVELLVVLVILGILAATILPRMIAQTRGAETAEAVNMLGSMRRAATSNQDGGVTLADFGYDAAGAVTGAGASFGFAPLGGTPRFTYAFVAATSTITATRIGGAAGETIAMDLGGTITCGADYTAVVSGTATVGCR